MTHHNSIGLWIRRRPSSLAGIDAWADRIEGYGIDTATLVLNAGTKPTHLTTWRRDLLVPAVAELRRRGIDVWLMCWPHAVAHRIDETLADLAGIVDAFVARSMTPPGVEIDAEGNHNGSGWGPAGSDLAGRLASGLRAAGFTRAAITAIPPRPGLRRQDLALLEALCASFGGANVEARPQAYSKDDPGKSWDNGEFFRPGVIQRATWKTWQPHCERLGCVLRMGGMLGFQNHPGSAPDGIEALRAAHDASSALGVTRWHYWVDNVMDKSAPYFLREAGGRVAGAAPAPPMADAPSEVPTYKDAIIDLQRALVQAGHDPGPIDGVLGQRTWRALEAARGEAQAIEAAAAAANLDGEAG